MPAPDTDSKARCRYCKDPIVWGRNVQTERGIPLDPEPNDKGKYVVTGVERHELQVKRIRSGEQIDPNLERRTNHFDTCASAPSR